MEARGGDTVEEMRERDFTFALDLVAGIEVMVTGPWRADAIGHGEPGSCDLSRRPRATSRAGNPPVATGPHFSGVTRMIDLPCLTMAARYSSQSGCSPEMFRKYSTRGSTDSGESMTSAVPSIWTQGPSQSSLSTTRLTRSSRLAFRVLARSGYVETTIRPESSTPQVNGEAWGCRRPAG